MVESTFNIESASTKGAASNSKNVGPKCVLGTKRKRGAWYASFIVQKNKHALKQFLNRLPFSMPPFLDAAKVCHSDAAWLFFGANPGQRPLLGRPEHTDAIAHSGTWHLQLLGSKVWNLRPTAELKRKAARALRGSGALKVRCEVGDVLCVNTRLWWHHTHLPGSCKMSASVARDMWLDGRKTAPCDMTNVDGHYATRCISAGTVLFTEDNAPDVALPRNTSSKSNCGLRELPNGSMAVVATRRIPKGDWFTMSDSEAEEEEGRDKKSRRKGARGS